MDFENRYMEFLKERAPLFETVKRRFNLGKQLGLASAPWAHALEKTWSYILKQKLNI